MEVEPEVKILLLGNENVGKTTFLSRISQSNANAERKEQIVLLKDINQPFVFDIRLFKSSYRFEFSDTASPENWKLLHPHVIILCYDISNRLSLIDIQKFWMKEVLKTFAVEEEIPVLVLGLKRDLRSEGDPNGIIYPQEAYRITQEMRCDKYLECSAITGELIREVFEDICRTAAMTTNAKGGLSEGGCTSM